MNKKDVYFSIVIPCFNEARGIAYLVSNLKGFEEKLETSSELVFVDDGSTDSTYEKLVDVYKNRIGKDVKICRHIKNKGIGAAIKTGISGSKGYYVSTVDSDCTYELKYLFKMLDIIREENADIVLASPYHPKGATFNVPRYRLFLSKNLSNLYNIILKNKFYTYTSMFRVYRREAIRDVEFKSDGFLSMAEILINAHRKGFKIIEYPSVLTVRKFGTSNAKISKVIREHLWFIIKILLKKEGI